MSKGAVTRQAVLDEAVDLASRLGLGGLTIGSLAASVEMSKSGLFAHFQSKEALQVQVLEHAGQRFVDLVLRPALSQPRGEPRVRELFERWLTCSRDGSPSGCLFIDAASELDDQPGAVREHLIRAHQDWSDSVAQVFRTGIAEGHFAADARPEQFAQDLDGVMLAFNHYYRLLGEAEAEERARRAFNALLAAARSHPAELT